MEHETFRAHLLKALERIGISDNLAEVSRRTGVNYHTIRDLLVRRPETEVSVETARQIADRLGFSLDTGLPTESAKELAELVEGYLTLPEDWKLMVLEDIRIKRLALGIPEPSPESPTEQPEEGREARQPDDQAL